MVTGYTCPYLLIITVWFHVLMVQYKKKLHIKLNPERNPEHESVQI